MAFVYEVNGQRIEFEKEPSEKDIDEAARSLKGTPQTARPRPVEGSGGAAFGVYPQAGRRPESQQDRVASQDMALQTARGVASNVPAVLGIPGTVVNTVANLPRTAQDIQNRYQIAKEAFTGQAPQTQPLPDYNQVTPYDMNYFGQLVPGPEPTSPAGQLAFAGGQIAGAPVMAKTIQGAAQVPGQVATTARELRTGATEGLRNPTYQSNATTAFQPLKETYYPTPEVQRFQAMPAAQRPAALPALEASKLPSADLFQSPGQLLARNLGPTAAGETLIPLQGRTARAFGEQIARDVSNRPLTSGGVGLGGAALGGLFGGPIGALAGAALAPGMRFAQLAAMNKLSQTAGFAPGFTQQLAAARGRAGIQSGMPTTPALGYTPSGGGGGGSAPGPVNPATMYAGAGGVSADLGTAGAAALNVKYPPMPAPTPAEVSQQFAASKIQPPKTPEQAAAQQAILDQVRARGEAEKAARVAALQQRAQAAGGYTPPTVEAPTVQPVVPVVETPPPAPRPKDLKSRLSALKANPDAVPPSQSLFENLPQYTEKEARMFETQQKNAPRGFGQSETVSEIEVIAAENKAFRTGTKRDQTIADEMRKRLDRQTELGITHITKKEAAEGATLSKQRRGPPGVSNMIVPEGGGPKSLATQFPENYKYDLDREKHFHGFDKPLTLKEYATRRFTNELKDKNSAQTYRIKEGDTVKTIAHDGPDLTVSVVDPATRNKIDYVRMEKSLSGKKFIGQNANKLNQTTYRKEVYTPDGAGVYDQWTEWSEKLPKNWPKEFKE